MFGTPVYDAKNLTLYWYVYSNGGSFMQNFMINMNDKRFEVWKEGEEEEDEEEKEE